MPMTARTQMDGAKYREASGNRGRQKRSMPYVPILSKMPASTTEPAVGASTCASGSQVWKGNIGTLMAKARKKARNSQVCAAGERERARDERSRRICSKSKVPLALYR